MADAPPFDPTKPYEPVSGGAPAFDPTKPYEAVAADDGYWSKAITDSPKEAWRAGKGMAESAYADVSSALAPNVDPNESYIDRVGHTIQGAGRLGRGLAEAVGVIPSAIIGAATPLVGRPEAALIHQAGRIINPEVAERQSNEQIYQDIKPEVGTALGVAMPKGAGPRNPVAPAAPAPVGADALANEQLANEHGFRLSRGQAMEDPSQIRYEDLAGREAYGPAAQAEARKFYDEQFAGIQTGGRNIGETVARGRTVAPTPGDAAETVNTELGITAERVRQAQAQAQAAAESEAAAQRAMVADRGQTLTEAIQEGHLPIENPREAGEIVGQDVRDTAARARREYQRRYDEALSLPGQFHAGAIEGMGTRVQGTLTHGNDPVIIDDVTTPTASRALRDLDNISNFRIQNRADPMGPPDPNDIVAVDLRGIDQARKRLVAFYRAARGSANAADARATGRVIDAFDDQIEQAISNGLFSGDPRALQALQEARSAYASYQRQFRPQQAGDDVGQAMRRIIDRQATPEEIANMVIGSGRVGTAGLPVRLYGRLEDVLGRDSDAISAIRQGIWQRVAQVRNAAGDVDPIKSAQSITQFAGSSLARRVFSPQELAAMRGHAQGLRDLEQAIADLPATQAAERMRTGYEQVFGGADIGGNQGAVFRRIMAGTATPEETAAAVFNAIGSGNPGNASRMISAIERIAGTDSEAMASIRQGVWQRLTQHPIGKDQPGQQKLVQSINEFLNGRGRSIANQLYTPQELTMMRRYADAVRLTIIPKYARTNSDTTPALLATLGRYGDAITTALSTGVGAVLGHGPLGAAAGYGVNRMIGSVVGSVKELRSAKKTAQQFDWLSNPPTPAVPKTQRLGAVAAGALEARNAALLTGHGMPSVPMLTDDQRKRQPATFKERFALGRADGGPVQRMDGGALPRSGNIEDRRQRGRDRLLNGPTGTDEDPGPIDVATGSLPAQAGIGDIGPEDTFRPLPREKPTPIRAQGGPVMRDDGGAIPDPAYDPATGMAYPGTVAPDAPSTADAPMAMKRLLGIGGEERFQTWPEKMVRSGLSLAGDVMSGAQALPGAEGETPGLTNLPGAVPYDSPEGREGLARVQDMAGMAGTGALGHAAESAATLGSGPIRRLGPAPERSLSLVPAADVEKSFGASQFRPAGTDHNYDIVSTETGKPLGAISLDASDPKSIMVNFIHNYEGGGANSLGPTLVRDLRNEIKDLYPDVEKLYGKRVSGAREASGVPRYGEYNYPKIGAPDAETASQIAQLDDLIARRSKNNAGVEPAWGVDPAKFKAWTDARAQLVEQRSRSDAAANGSGASPLLRSDASEAGAPLSALERAGSPYSEKDIDHWLLQKLGYNLDDFIKRMRGGPVTRADGGAIDEPDPVVRGNVADAIRMLMSRGPSIITQDDVRNALMRSKAKGYATGGAVRPAVVTAALAVARRRA